MTMPSRCRDIAAKSQIPAREGISLKSRHIREILDTVPDIGWFEVHTENYMGAGGLPHACLDEIRKNYPLSFHGVGLSLGTAGRLDPAHLLKIRELAARYEPGLISEHLSWSIVDGQYLNDLLPLPYTSESLKIVVDHVAETQEFLGRRILLENPSVYVSFTHSEMSEPEFLMELTRQTGCGILLDVNNIYVSACNIGFDADQYLQAIPPHLVGEIHLAGHHMREVEGHIIRIDDHGSPVSPPVWQLYERAITRCGAVPTLIEWDTDVPALDVLMAEAGTAADLMSAILREVQHAPAG